MDSPLTPAVVAARAVEALSARAGPSIGDRTVALLLAVPHRGRFHANAPGEVEAAGGRLLIRGEVVLGSFTSVPQALKCAGSLLIVGTDPAGSMGIGVDYLTLPLDAAGNPVGSSLADLAALTGITEEGQLLVSDRVIPLLSEVRHAPFATLPRAGRPLPVHEAAWRRGQRIGKRRSSAWMVGLVAVAMALIGVLVAREWTRVQEEASIEQQMMVELPVALPMTRGAAPVAGDHDPSQTAEAATAGDRNPPEIAEAAVARKSPARKLGSLTLLTTPTATVKLKGRSLGSTPLSRVPLEVGTHVLELIGPDGTVKVLSVPIQVGKVTAFRLKLDELPTR